MAEEIIGKVDQNEKEEDSKISQQAENAIEDEIDEIELLQAEIDKLRQQSQEYLDGWQRERAEFANYKKRKEKESQLLQNNISGNIIRKYLDIVDDLERALQNQPEEGEGASWAKGIELIYRKFLSALEAEGVVPMKVKGQQFDPNLHEAISLEPNEEYESGQIIEVLRNGYLIGDRVIRPASVRIAQ